MSDAAKDADAGRRVYSLYPHVAHANDPQTDVRRFYSFDVAASNGSAGNCRAVACGNPAEPWKPQVFPKVVHARQRFMVIGAEVAVSSVLLILSQTRDICLFIALWFCASAVTARSAPFG